MKIVGKVNIESLSEFEVNIINDLRGMEPNHIKIVMKFRSGSLVWT